MLAGVGDEIDIEGADALLEDAPHRLAEIGHDPHQRQPREAIAARRAAVVGRQQVRVLVAGQLVVDAEVAEIEERVAHPGVLPVDDADPGAVVDEVRVEQVVVTRPQLERVGQAGELDPAADRGRELVLGRDAHAAGHRQRPVRLDDAQRDEQPRDRRAVVDSSQRVGDPVAVSPAGTSSSLTGEPSMNRVTR